MPDSVQDRRPAGLKLAVLLGDPRLPYDYNLSDRFERQDYEAVGRLREALGTLGHACRFLNDHARLATELSADPPELALNFCNTGFMNRGSRQLHVPALLEMLDIPYTGAGPECMAVCHDKAMVMHVAHESGIAVPWHQYCRLGEPRPPQPQRYPAILKPNFGDGSIGIEGDAVVRDADGLERCLQRLQRDFDRPGILIQGFLPGREYSVGVIGNPDTGFTCLPPLEVDFSALDPGLPAILTLAAKVDPESAYWRQTRLRQADIPETVRERLHADCRTLFARLGCQDYARFDFRCDDGSTPRLIDVNAHPMWGDGGMMATMAGFAGYPYERMLALIVDAGRARLAGAI